MNEQTNIGVFFGSRSPEHDISIITAELIIAGLKGLGYAPIPVYLNKQGEWLLGEELSSLDIFTKPGKEVEMSRLKRYHLDLEESVGKMVFRKKGLFGKKITVELAFPAFHGSNGEDGTIQGLFEIFNLPYVGCDVTSSALTMDKILTKQIYEQQAIPTTKFIFFESEDWEHDQAAVLDGIEKQLKWPLFVKPPRLGSSIGIAKVTNRRELELAVEVALHYGSRVLVEEAVEDVMDITVALLGNRQPQPSLLQESLFSEGLFSYEEKYLRGGGAQLGKAKTNIVIPARVGSQIARAIQALAVKIFEIFGCSGIARVDFLYDKKTQKYYANEINTLPGTLYHHLWEKTGVSLALLLEKLISLGKERYDQKNRFTYTFASDILQVSSAGKLQFKKDKK